MKHFLGIKDLEKNYVLHLIQIAKELQKTKPNFSRLLNHKLIALLFFEASTRTKASFQIASLNLQAKILDLNLGNSSVQKGETLIDTARTLTNLGANCIIIRHSLSQAPLELAEALENVQIINAGDGTNEHPTQALLDLFTILECTDNLKNKQITIVGDCLHSRVARSNIYLLSKFGAKINLIGPPSLAPKELENLAENVKVYHSLEEGLFNTDFLMVLRLQKERQATGLIKTLEDYSKNYKITQNVLEKAKVNFNQIKILHPGPVNRGIEIDSELVDKQEVSLVNRQVFNGLYVRMAVLLDLLWE